MLDEEWNRQCSSSSAAYFLWGSPASCSHFASSVDFENLKITQCHTLVKKQVLNLQEGEADSQSQWHNLTCSCWIKTNSGLRDLHYGCLSCSSSAKLVRGQTLLSVLCLKVGRSSNLFKCSIYGKIVPFMTSVENISVFKLYQTLSCREFISETENRRFISQLSLTSTAWLHPHIIYHRNLCIIFTCHLCLPCPGVSNIGQGRALLWRRRSSSYFYTCNIVRFRGTMRQIA